MTFCIHCGYPLSIHSDGELLCPARPNIVLRPCCDCHEIRPVTVTAYLFAVLGADEARGRIVRAREARLGV